jgi:mercuric ion transport protein
MSGDPNAILAIESADGEGNDHKGLVATGGILAALGVSSCCVLPLVLTVFGISGAWMANLRALEAYQPFFLAFALIMIGLGFYQVYFKPKNACAPGTACARPLPNRLVKSMLWLATFIILIALTFPYWFSTIEPYLP